MAASKYKCSMKTNVNSKLVMGFNSQRKENTYLKKILVELSQQHAEHNKLVERFLTLVSIILDSQKEPCKQEVNPCCGTNMRRKTGGGSSPASMSDEQASTSSELREELQNCFRDALEENKQWLEYDQQREACVRGMMTRMLWLEDQLDKANQARSQQHNEDYSEHRASQPQANFQGRMQINDDTIGFLMRGLPVVRDHLSVIYNRFFGCGDSEENEQKELPGTESGDYPHSEDEEQQDNLDDKLVGLLISVYQNVSMIYDRCDSRENEHKEQPQAEIEDHHQSEDEEQQLIEDTKDLQSRLDEERRGYISELQEDQQDPGECAEKLSPSQHSRESLRSSSNSSSSLDESILQCPHCQAVYPSNLYRELVNHLETCLD